jgi:pimeloyl-ACP methyl ester carboxylesterase
MRLLTPSEAAAIADGAYEARINDNLQEVGPEDLGCAGLFSVGGALRIEGRTGGLFVRPLSGMGYVASGEGDLSGDVLIATRGTVLSTGSDVVTDLRLQPTSGPTGDLVHSGFLSAWDSMEDSVREFLQGRNPTRIHCVGHSMGGAISMLAAAMLAKQHVADVVVYTFGAPRVGDVMFSKSITEELGPGRILRVVHPADPIAMVPTFPFWHAPFAEEGLVLASGWDQVISFGAHSIEDSYRPAVEGLGWEDLRVGVEASPDNSHVVKAALQGALEGAVSGLMGSAFGLAIMRGVLSELLHGVVPVVGSLVPLGGAALADVIALYLNYSYMIHEGIRDQLRGLVSMIMHWVQGFIEPFEDVTLGLLRWLLNLLTERIRTSAQLALSSIALRH